MRRKETTLKGRKNASVRRLSSESAASRKLKIRYSIRIGSCVSYIFHLKTYKRRETSPIFFMSEGMSGVFG
jgi:hypothetical protein